MRGGVREDGCNARARHGGRVEDGVVGDGSVGRRTGDVIAEEVGGVILYDEVAPVRGGGGDGEEAGVGERGDG